MITIVKLLLYFSNAPWRFTIGKTLIFFSVCFPCLIKGPENNCQEQTHNEPKITSWNGLILLTMYWFAEKAFSAQNITYLFTFLFTQENSSFFLRAFSAFSCMKCPQILRQILRHKNILLLPSESNSTCRM